MPATLNGSLAGGGGGASLPVSNPASLLSGATASRVFTTNSSGNGAPIDALPLLNGRTPYYVFAVDGFGNGALVTRESIVSGGGGVVPTASIDFTGNTVTFHGSGGYQTLGIENSTRHIGFFNVAPVGRQSCPTTSSDPAVTELKGALNLLGLISL